MSSQDKKEATPPETITPTREPRALSTEYHKARKQAMLWAGILFIWELVGIDLTKAENAEGNVGAIVRSIKSPQAVPWVLLILVGYFIFKLHIEWRQCNEARRQVREAKLDYYSAWIVSVAAIALYIGQTISKAQFADIFQRYISTGFPGFLTGVAISFMVSELLTERKKWAIVLTGMMVLTFGFFIPIIKLREGIPFDWLDFFIGMSGSLPLASVLYWLGLARRNISDTTVINHRPK